MQKPLLPYINTVPKKNKVKGVALKQPLLVYGDLLVTAATATTVAVTA